MAKKNLNPADAHRKALRKKELKKAMANKAGRTKARDFALVKKDTGDLEDAIEQLTAEDPESPRLQELKDELEKINRKKAEYVAEHPDQRRLVYRPRRKEGEDVEELVLRKRKMFDKNGIPRHPERSIYYDPIMNPFGVAPPGMPYAQRPLLPGEVDSEEDDDDDDDIPMPSGRPPLPDGAEYVDSDEDIPLPDGVPPGKEQLSTLPPLPPNMPSPPSGLDTPMQPPAGLNPFPPPPPPPPGFPASFPQVPGGAQFPILPPTGFPQGMTLPPPPPPVFPGNIPAPGYPQLPLHGFPVQPNFPPFPPTGFAQGSTFLPAPPPGFFPRRIQSSASMQDPLSSVPHQTFQAHRASQLAPPHPSLPQNPTATQGTTLPPTSASLPPRPTTAAELAAATVFAEPQLRDFKKEATAFVPSTLKRKKAADAGSTTKKSKVDAAPALGPDTADDENKQTPIVSARPDLLSVLKGQFGPAPTEGIAASGKSKPEVKKKDDYEKFVEEIGDLLGPKA